MKAKRSKTGDGGAKKNENGNILERQESVVERLSSEVSGKAQKYTRAGPHKFLQYNEEELSTEGIKVPCEKHFSPSLERKGLSCERPSCHSMKHIPDLKVIHVRFTKSLSTPDSRPIANDYELSSSRQQCFSDPVTPPRQNRQDPNKAQSTGSPNAKHLIPKSLSILHMMKLGKLAKLNESVSVQVFYSFDLENIAWSLLPQKVEFVIEEDVL